MGEPGRSVRWCATVALLGAILSTADAAELALRSARPQAYPALVEHSPRTISLAVEIDRDGFRLLAYTIKERPFVRPSGIALPRPVSTGSDVRLELVLSSAGGDSYTQRLDVGRLCLEHGSGEPPHQTGDRILLHRDTAIVEVPEIAGFDRLQAAIHEMDGTLLRRRALGEERLDSRRFTPAGGLLGYEDLAFARIEDGGESGVPLETPGTVHWPEEYGDPDVTLIYGDANEVDSRINIVLVPDGYTYAEKSVMEAHVADMVAYLRTKTPYKEHDLFLNYILVYAYSTDSGTDECDCGVVRDTPMSTGFPNGGDPCGGSANRCLFYGWSCDTDTSANISAAELRAPAQDETLVLVNTTRYGGCAGSRAVFSAGNSAAVEIAVHELGHSLANLADEYAGNAGCGGAAGGINSSTNPVDGGWPEWIPEIGPPHEGAQYYDQCIYRPEDDCEMRSLNQPFCRVCNQQWARQIFGHPRVAPTAPIASMTPDSPVNVPLDAEMLFSVETRLAVGNTDEITWLLQGPGYPTPTVVAIGVADYGFTPTVTGVYTLTCEVIADTNLVKPSKNAGNVDTVIWSVTSALPGDGDADGYTLAGGDCDDTDPDVYPGAPEISDGQDNQCPGDPGYGLSDETGGESGFFDPGNANLYSWPELEGATTYRVIRASTLSFSFPCVLRYVTEPSWEDGATPSVGSIFFYLNSAISPFTGSWGADSAGVERTISCLLE